jgi:chemotaxis protein CheY-P-specific phosphatase CheC
MENLAFMFADQVSKEDLPPAQEPLSCAAISFSGHASGTMMIVAGEALCDRLCADMLGIEPEDEACHLKSGDALKEALNTICGQFLTAMAGEDPVFSLTPPEISVIDQQQWEEIKDKGGTLFFSIDRSPVLLWAEYETVTCT